MIRQNGMSEEMLRKKETAAWMRYAKEDYNLVQYLYRGEYYPKLNEMGSREDGILFSVGF